MKIAVDFDGTLVEDKYPKIGKEKPFAFEALKMFMQRGYFLILWTSRTGKHLEEAVDYCRKKGVEFYAVNKNYCEEVLQDGYPRKIIADIFIDDRDIFAEMDWQKIYFKVLDRDAERARTSR
jgi:hydroxymethylpyrimidine pyrophosphatase-like HAD family hydrolase